MIRAAKIENSSRLQRFVGFLSDGLWHGTREIVEGAHIMAVNSAASECRSPVNGLQIETRCTGRGRFEYRLKSPFDGETS